MTDDVDRDAGPGDRLQPTGKSRGAVIAVRMPPELFSRLADYAAAQDMTVSDVVRTAVERLVDARAATPSPVVSSGAFIPSGSLASLPAPRSSARAQEREAAVAVRPQGSPDR